MKSSIALRREIQIFRCISLLESFYKQIFGLRLHWQTDLTYWTAALCSLLIVISHRPNAYGFVATVWIVRQVGELARVQLGSLLKCLDHERALLYLTRDLHEAIHPVFGLQSLELSSAAKTTNRCSPKVFVPPNLRYMSLAISALIVGDWPLANGRSFSHREQSWTPFNERSSEISVIQVQMFVTNVSR